MIGGEFVGVDAIDISWDVFGRRWSGDDNTFGTIVKMDIAILMALKTAGAF